MKFRAKTCKDLLEEAEGDGRNFFLKLKQEGIKQIKANSQNILPRKEKEIRAVLEYIKWNLDITEEDLK